MPADIKRVRGEFGMPRSDLSALILSSPSCRCAYSTAIIQQFPHCNCGTNLATASYYVLVSRRSSFWLLAVHGACSFTTHDLAVQLAHTQLLGLHIGSNSILPT